jgi:uncharacterized protein
MMDSRPRQWPVALPFAFFALAFAISWACWIPAALMAGGTVPGLVAPELLLVAGSFGPSGAAFVLTARQQGMGGVWRLLKRGFDPRLPLAVFLTIVFVPIVITGIAAGLSGGSRATVDPLTLLVTFVLFFFFGGSFGEEFGWRGYALPRLLRFWNVPATNLILGLTWGCWHLPLFWVPGTTQASTPFWLYLVFTISFAALFTWAHLRSRGNVLAALLLHTVFNLTVVLFPPVTSGGGVDVSMYYITPLFALVGLAALFAAPSVGNDGLQPGSSTAT